MRRTAPRPEQTPGENSSPLLSQQESSEPPTYARTPNASTQPTTSPSLEPVPRPHTKREGCAGLEDPSKLSLSLALLTPPHCVCGGGHRKPVLVFDAVPAADGTELGAVVVHQCPLHLHVLRHTTVRLRSRHGCPRSDLGETFELSCCPEKVSRSCDKCCRRRKHKKSFAQPTNPLSASLEPRRQTCAPRICWRLQPAFCSLISFRRWFSGLTPPPPVLHDPDRRIAKHSRGNRRVCSFCWGAL
jgi:hypothetical protein